MELSLRFSEQNYFSILMSVFSQDCIQQPANQDNYPANSHPQEFTPKIKSIQDFEPRKQL